MELTVKWFVCRCPRCGGSHRWAKTDAADWPQEHTCRDCCYSFLESDANSEQEPFDLSVDNLLFFNRELREKGQNAFVKKVDVKNLISCLAADYMHNPVLNTRFQELLDDVENLQI